MRLTQKAVRRVALAEQGLFSSPELREALL
jgi:hypothetical protein